jgi:hypothetical protein
MSVSNSIIRLNDGNGWKIIHDQAATKVFIQCNGVNAQVDVKEKNEGQYNTVYNSNLKKIEIESTTNDQNQQVKLIRVNDGSNWGFVYDKNAARVFIQCNGVNAQVDVKETNDSQFINKHNGNMTQIEIEYPIGPLPPEEGVLTLDNNGMVTLPNGIKIQALGDKLIESYYGNQIIRSNEGGTFEASALIPDGDDKTIRRANGIVQGYITLPPGIKGMKSGGRDEGTVLLKDNHGPGGDTNHQYKVWFEYKEPGKVDGIKLGREHIHPNTEELENVKYVNQPKFAEGGRMEFIGCYQDTNDDGVRLRMWYKDENSKWVILFDHVDYGDGDEDKVYRGKSGVQDGTRVDGRVGGGKPSEDDNDEYKKIRNKPMKTTKVENEDLKKELSKLAQSAIWAREIEPDNSNLHDNVDDPLSFGPK